MEKSADRFKVELLVKVSLYAPVKATSLDEALEASKKLKLSDVLTIKRPDDMRDMQLEIAGVTNQAVVDKLYA